MPTIIRVGQFRLYFWSHESSRIHIHVMHIGLGIETSIWMDDFTIKKTSGDKRVDNASIDLAEKYKDQIISAWNEHFGANNEEK